MLRYVVAAVGIVVLVYIGAVAPGKYKRKQAEPFIGVNFAHRGLHEVEKGIPENSMAAFKAAAEAGYGIELDLRLSADGEVVVHHDDTLSRSCGAAEAVEDLTYARLREKRLFGTEERIPLFSDVLKEAAGRVPLVIEIKPVKKYAELCAKVKELLRDYSGAYCIESFSPYVVYWVKKNMPEVLRGQLTSTYGDLRATLNPITAWAACSMLYNCLTRPQFVSHSAGKMPINVRACIFLEALPFVWTVRSEAQAAALEESNVGIIFENYRPAARFETKVIR